MGQRLYYEGSISDVLSRDIDSEIEDNTQYKERIEHEILALMCMDPSKVRNLNKKESDEEDYAWMNNAQYLAKRWEELKREYEEVVSKLTMCHQAKYAMETATRHVQLCPDCMVEVDSGYNHDTYKFEYKCPKCGKTFQCVPYGMEKEAGGGPYSIDAEIKRFYDSI